MELNEILNCINAADYENAKELVVNIDDLQTLRKEIRRLQEEVNELLKSNKILSNTIRPRALNSYRELQ